MHQHDCTTHTAHFDAQHADWLARVRTALDLANFYLWESWQATDERHAQVLQREAERQLRKVKRHAAT